MRDLKFRAWIFGGLDDDASPFMEEVSALKRDDFLGLEIHWTQHSEFSYEKECHLMQFTSLKDGSGKEIYEGDILENMNGHRFVMEYGGLAFGYRGLTPYANGFVEFSYDTITNPKITEILELKIIGNIYENPELLEPTGG